MSAAAYHAALIESRRNTLDADMRIDDLLAKNAELRQAAAQAIDDLQSLILATRIYLNAPDAHKQAMLNSEIVRITKTFK